MASTALFSSSPGGSRPLVEFRAGRCLVNVLPTTSNSPRPGNMIIPDKRKGLVYIYRSNDDTLIHFCWRERSAQSPEEDWVLMPEDAEWCKVDSSSNGRVYLLKFKSNGQKCFYWMQEPQAEKDEELSTRINQLINNPSSADSSGTGASFSSSRSALGLTPGAGGSLGANPFAALGALGGLDLGAGLEGDPFMSLLNALGPDALSALSGGSLGPRDRSTASSRPSTGLSSNRSVQRQQPASSSQGQPSAAAQPGQPTAPIQLTDLQRIMANIMPSIPALQSSPEVDLNDIVNVDSLRSLSEPARSDLRQHLPVVPSANSTVFGASDPETATSQTPGAVVGTEAELLETVRSPQFRQSVSAFSSALASGQIGTLLKQFGIDENSATEAAKADVEGFAKALEAAEKQGQTGSSSSSSANGAASTQGSGANSSSTKGEINKNQSDATTPAPDASGSASGSGSSGADTGGSHDNEKMDES